MVQALSCLLVLNRDREGAMTRRKGREGVSSETVLHVLSPRLRDIAVAFSIDRVLFGVIHRRDAEIAEKN
jgi:hypothetical protein